MPGCLIGTSVFPGRRHSVLVRHVPLDLTVMTRINANAASLLARVNLARTTAKIDQTLVRLATGSQLNSGRDNPAALIASDTLRAQIVELEAELSGRENVGHLLSVADSALDQIGDVLNDVQGTLVSAGNTATTSEAEAQFQREAVASAAESIQRITSSTRLGGQNVFDRSLESGLSPADDSVLTDVRSQLALATTNLTQAFEAGDLATAAEQVAVAQSAVSTARARAGALQLYAVETQSRVLEAEIVQLSEARSQLTDTDFALETSLLTRLRTLQSSGVLVVKEAADRPAALLALFER
jgi:flagellin-like hook-associated protein FlgL